MALVPEGVTETRFVPEDEAVVWHWPPRIGYRPGFPSNLPMTEAKRRAVRERRCSVCGRVETIRADNRSVRCKSCSSRVAVQKALTTIRSRPPVTAECPQCGRHFKTTRTAIRHAKVHCCSRRCRSHYCTALRVCKFCGSEFRTEKSRIKADRRTNSSANFCSRECYSRWLCKPDRVKGRGSQWRAIRHRVLARAPYCAQCGTTKKLDVHHIVPFRITHDNRLVNLIPLCKKCHKSAESILNDVVLTGLTPSLILLAFGSILRERQLATQMKLRSLLHANGKHV